MGRLALILSPHLDDAILSCPGYIQSLRGQGAKVVIASVFTESDASQAGFYRERRAEDRRAARILGASVAHMGFLDAPFRAATYRNFCGIVFGRGREYPRTLREISVRVSELLAKLRPERILAPMAIGNHVDHRLVRDVALAIAGREGLLFYEDRPYAFVRGAKEGKLTPGYFEAAYVRSYLGRTRPSSVAAKWAGVEPFPREVKPALSVSPDAAVMATTLRAIRAYGSQIGDLFADSEECISLYQSTPEVLWRVD